MSLASIREQLDLEKRAFGYAYGPPEVDGYMTERLAAYLVQQGVEDIRDLKKLDQLVSIDKQFGTAPDGSPIMGKQTVRATVLYNALTGRQLPEFKRPEWGAGPTGWDVVYIDGVDRWRVWMRAKFTTDGVVFFVPDIEHTGSSGVFSGLIETAGPVMPFISIALAFLVPGLGAAIGQLILPGALAAAAPALVPIIGNVALSTAFNGGDIEAAVIGALTGSLGGLAGGAVASATDSVLVGKLASSATSAALRGGDLKQAVAGTLLAEGAKNVNINAFRQQLGDAWASEPAGSWEATDWSAPVDPSYADWWDTAASNAVALDWYDAPPVAAADYFDPVYEAPADLAPGPASSVFDPYGMDAPATSLPATTAPADGGWDVDAAIVTLTNAALAAIRVNQAYQASQAPAPRTSTQTGSLVKTGNPNGTVTVRNAQTGQTAIAKPEVGVPYTLANGSTIINNGNGTYTTIRADGSQTTSAYPSTLPSSGGGFMDTLKAVPTSVWIGAGLIGGVLALRGAR